MWGRARLGTGSVDRFGDPRASSEHILFLPARPDNQFASDADLDSGHAIYRSLQASAPYGACGQSVVILDQDAVFTIKFRSHFQRGRFRRFSPVRINPSLAARRCEG